MVLILSPEHQPRQKVCRKAAAVHQELNRVGCPLPPAPVTRGTRLVERLERVALRARPDGQHADVLAPQFRKVRESFAHGDETRIVCGHGTVAVALINCLLLLQRERERVQARADVIGETIGESNERCDIEI